VCFFTKQLILSHFLNQLTDDGKLYMKDNAVAQTANNSVDVLDEAFGRQVIS
jgi:hypothetical protein